MKIALLADVHGNLEALDAVLCDLDLYAPEALVVCAGDVVGYGPDPAACLERLETRRAVTIMGNHEQMVLGNRELTRCTDAGVVAAVWTRARLAPLMVQKLAALPSWAEPVEGVVVCHGDLRDASTYLSSEERARAALTQLQAFRPQARVLVCGHTHHAMLFTETHGFARLGTQSDYFLPEQGRCIINPGSVGQSRDGRALARYALLDLERGMVRYAALHYDHLTTLGKMRKAGLIAEVVMTRPRGFARRVAREKARWARLQARVSTPAQAIARPPLRPLADDTNRGACAPVSAVVVTYNSKAVVGSALMSLEPSFRAGLLQECLVIDNQSRDGTPDLVRAAHPWCTVIENKHNIGFGRACNVGFRHSRASHVLLLNPDATLTKEALEHLLACLAREPKAGAVAPAIREPTGNLQPAGGLITPRTLMLEALGRRAPGDRRSIEPGCPPFRTSWLCGAVVLLRRSMIEHVGGFDPRFFLYFEETDLWMRALQAGWELWAVGDAVATHVQGASARTVSELYQGCIPEHFFRSRFRYLTKHFGWPLAALTELTELSTMSARAVASLRRGRSLRGFQQRLGAPLFGFSASKTRGPGEAHARGIGMPSMASRA